MDQEQLRALFEQVRAGAMDIDAAMVRMRHMPFEDLGFAKIDHHRALRHGIPEVVFAKGKTADQVVAIAGKLLENARNVLITRADTECAAAVTAALAGAASMPRYRAPSASGATVRCMAKEKSRSCAPAPAICR